MSSMPCRRPIRLIRLVTPHFAASQPLHWPPAAPDAFNQLQLIGQTAPSQPLHCTRAGDACARLHRICPGARGISHSQPLSTWRPHRLPREEIFAGSSSSTCRGAQVDNETCTMQAAAGKALRLALGAAPAAEGVAPGADALAGSQESHRHGWDRSIFIVSDRGSGSPDSGSPDSRRGSSSLSTAGRGKLHSRAQPLNSREQMSSQVFLDFAMSQPKGKAQGSHNIARGSHLERVQTQNATKSQHQVVSKPVPEKAAAVQPYPHCRKGVYPEAKASSESGARGSSSSEPGFYPETVHPKLEDLFFHRKISEPEVHHPMNSSLMPPNRFGSHGARHPRDKKVHDKA